MITGQKLIQLRKRLEDEEVIEADIPLTCDDCPRNEVCEYAFDPYNTDGDCLDLK